MKKVLLAFTFCMVVYAGFAATTYDNNQYQQKSRAYSQLAEKVYAEGDYDAAAEYARDAEENAELSAAFIESMLARSSAEKKLLQARTRLAWAKEHNAEHYFPSALKEAVSYIDQADSSFASDNYPETESFAEKAIASLATVRDIIPLPAKYVVNPWDPSRDCFWNIAKNPAVYDDPFMWEKLYEANRKNLKRASNPNLLIPNMTVIIPSIRGEFREGTYDPAIKYESFKKLTE